MNSLPDFAFVASAKIQKLKKGTEKLHGLCVTEEASAFCGSLLLGDFSHAIFMYLFECPHCKLFFSTSLKHSNLGKHQQE